MWAYRKTPDGVIAGLKIDGTAEQPEVRIYSEPAMSDADAISYLVTGHASRSGGGGRQVAGAAALLGSNVLSSAVGSKIGLDEAQVETGGSLNEAALVAGKYVTPNLFLSYTVGLFDRSNLVRLRYILSPNWAVQTETGTTQGADVFYKFERGGK
jgi:translocation and assembly module TamB